MLVKIHFEPDSNSGLDLDRQIELYNIQVRNIRLMFKTYFFTYFTKEEQPVNHLPSYVGTMNAKHAPAPKTFKALLDSSLKVFFTGVSLYNDNGVEIRVNDKGYFLYKKAFSTIGLDDYLGLLVENYTLDDNRFIPTPTTHEKPQ